MSLDFTINRIILRSVLRPALCLESGQVVFLLLRSAEDGVETVCAGFGFFAGLTAIFGKLGVEGLNPTWQRSFVRSPFWSSPLPSGERHFPKVDEDAARHVSGAFRRCRQSWLPCYRALQLAPAAPADRLGVAFAIVLGVLFLGEAAHRS
jgi:transporter family protein